MPELDPYTPGSGTTSLSVDHYDLSLDYRILPNRLTARAILHGQVRQDCAALSLDLVGLAVSKVAVNGRRHRFKQQNRSLILRDRSRPFVEGEEIRIDVQYAGNPAPAMGTWGDVGWEELEDGVLVAGQPTGAATWFPCNDHPSDKATFRVSILLDSDYTAISNGDLLRTVRKAGRTEWVWESLTPLATYLATMQIGQYKRGRLHHGSARPARVPIHVACEERVWDRAQKALAVQHSMLNAFEERFGPYPFSAYTVVVASEDLEIPLESQPLSILGPNHLTGEWTEERLVAHELAHQWFGNSVTPRSWADIWLNEGFACYAEWLWSEASGRDSAEAWARTYHSRLAGQPQDLVLADPGPESMFDDRVYKRGALTLHALRRAAGDEDFFSGVRAWSKEYRHGIADTAAFLEVFSRASGVDAGAVSRPWLFEKRLPALR